MKSKINKSAAIRNLGFLILLSIVSTLGHALGTATGFFVSTEGHIATNFHVVRDTDRIFVRTQDGMRYEAKLLSVDKDKDLALIQINKKSIPLFLRSLESKDKGKKIFTMGFPSPSSLGYKESKYSEGVVSALIGDDTDPSVFQVSTPLQPGNSGGPLLTGDGEVVGVVKQKHNALATLKYEGFIYENVNYAIKVDYLLPMLESLRIKRSNLAASANSDLQRIDRSIALIVVSHTKDFEDQKPSPEPKASAAANNKPEILPYETIFDGSHSLVGAQLSAYGADELEYVITEESNGWRRIKTKSGNELDSYKGLTFVYQRNSSVGEFYKRLIDSLGELRTDASTTATYQTFKGSWMHTLTVENKQRIQTPIGLREVFQVLHIEAGLNGNNFKEEVRYWIDSKTLLPWRRVVNRVSGRPSERTSFEVILVKLP